MCIPCKTPWHSDSCKRDIPFFDQTQDPCPRMKYNEDLPKESGCTANERRRKASNVPAIPDPFGRSLTTSCNIDCSFSLSGRTSDLQEFECHQDQECIIYISLVSRTEDIYNRRSFQAAELKYWTNPVARMAIKHARLIGKPYPECTESFFKQTLRTTPESSKPLSL